MERVHLAGRGPPAAPRPYAPQTSRRTASERTGNEILREHASLKALHPARLERDGPLPSRILREHSAAKRDEKHPWWGARNVSLMLQILNMRGVVAVVGRSGGSRLWDLAERWYPEVERVSLRDAERVFAAKRFRAPACD